MTLYELKKVMSFRQELVIFSMDRDGDETEIFDGLKEDCPEELEDFEVVTVEADVEVNDRPIKNTIHGVLVVILDEVPDGYL